MCLSPEAAHINALGLIAQEKYVHQRLDVIKCYQQNKIIC